MPYDGLLTLDDVDVAGKRVLLRVAYDVPLKSVERGALSVEDDTRIQTTIPTIQRLLEANCSVVICGGWIGRPRGVVDPALRMDPVASRLSELLNRPVVKLDDCVGPDVEQAVSRMNPGEIVVLENTRFHPGERTADPALADQLAGLAELCVFDAFGQAHRIHASTTGLVERVATVLGPLMVRELTALEQLKQPNHPFVVVLGGKKITDKAAVFRRLLDVADHIVVGGALANVFLQAQGIETGRSVVEAQDVDGSGVNPQDVAQELMERAGAKLHLPVDGVVSNDPLDPLAPKVVRFADEGVPPTLGLYDIGPETVRRFTEVIRSARTVFMNGLLGVTETAEFRRGTDGVVDAILDCRRCVTVAGGGDTEGYIHSRKIAGRFTHVSTGGGAALKVVSGTELAVITALKQRGDTQVAHG